MHGKAYIFHHRKTVTILHREILYFENRLPETCFRFFYGKIHFPSNHEIGHRFRRSVFHIQNIDELSPIQNSAAVGNLLDLRKFMRNQDNGLSFVPKSADDVQKKVDFLRRENGSRLIKYKNLRLPIQHFQNLHTLLNGNTDVLDDVLRIDLQTVVLRKRLHFLSRLLQIHIRKNPEALIRNRKSQNDIFRNTVILYQFKMLMYHADAQLRRITRRMNFFLLAAYPNLALIRLIHSEKHTHQC